MIYLSAYYNGSLHHTDMDVSQQNDDVAATS